MNYIGGKHKLLPQLLPLFPRNINAFVDLFCGGCNVGLNVDSQRVICNDNLTYLIDLYQTFLSNEGHQIMTHVCNRIDEYNLSITNRDGYNALRDLYNKQREPLDLFVLVAYAFNHQIRFNNAHKFNTPFGLNRSTYNPSMQRNLCNFLNRLHQINVEFTNFDFADFDFDTLTTDDFVYCDPPYLIATGTYNDGHRGFTGWNETEEKRLLQLLTELDRKGIRFALSNVLEHKGKKNNILQSWIDKNNWTVNRLSADYSNSNYHLVESYKRKSDEVLITNYTPRICTK